MTTKTIFKELDAAEDALWETPEAKRYFKVEDAYNELQGAGYIHELQQPLKDNPMRQELDATSAVMMATPEGERVTRLRAERESYLAAHPLNNSEDEDDDDDEDD